MSQAAGSNRAAPRSSGCHMAVKSLRRLMILFLSLIAYLNIGAAVFSHTEQNHALEKRSEFDLYVSDFRDRHVRPGHCESMNVSELETLISRLEESILTGSHGNKTRDRWDFIGAFFFSATVITTIGYGRTFPKTKLGMNLCVIYALFGIPLTAYLLAEIGIVLRPHAILAARKLNSLLVGVLRNKGVAWVTTWCVILSVVYGVIIGLPALGVSYMEDWSYDDAYYFCFMSLSTIGFGDHVAASSLQEEGGVYSGDTVYVIYTLGIIVYILFGLSVIAVLLTLIQNGDGILLESEVSLYIRGDYDVST